MDSGATRPHAEAQEPPVQQPSRSTVQTDPADVFLAESASLTLLPSGSSPPGIVPASADISSMPSAAPTFEVAPAPPPILSIASLARYQRVERFVNIVLAVLALIAAAPLMLLIAIAVKVTSSGPIFYRQPRVGLNRRGVRLHARRRSDTRWHLWARFLAMHDNLREQDLGGQVFMIYKFRTMCESAERETGAVWAVQNDPAVRPSGASSESIGSMSCRSSSMCCAVI